VIFLANKNNKPRIYIDRCGRRKELPELCPKCGSTIGVYLHGEPVFRCTNKKCMKYFGTVPFPVKESVTDALLKIYEAEMVGDISKNERDMLIKHTKEKIQ
jgi:hypothetical protein